MLHLGSGSRGVGIRFGGSVEARPVRLLAGVPRAASTTFWAFLVVTSHNGP
jgi:hypothetical protein